MPFTDRARIHVEGGRGGGGCVSFRREPHKPRGGPDGGNGGKGGNVMLRVDETADDLSYFRQYVHFSARSGVPGEGSGKHGAGGDTLMVPVPLDTRVFRDDHLIAHMTEPGQQIQVARGGNGGTGNRAFRSSTNQTPRRSTPGEPGEATWLTLEFRLPVAVAVVGLPNSGKSAVLAALTGAPANVAPYPHTTREPELGMLNDELGDRWLIADLPGLDDSGEPRRPSFLRQIERAPIILHCVDVTDPRPADERIATVRRGIDEWRDAEAAELVIATACPASECPQWADHAVDIDDDIGGIEELQAVLVTMLETDE